MSKATITTITDKVMEGMAEWSNRPLDSDYPVLFVDAINVRIRDRQVVNRPINVVMALPLTATATSWGSGPVTAARAPCTG
ncbi:transposase [Streptomyces anthocyanicus]|uniref:transposase n=1 Tax=Streptomyces anthocyanicus TaxID=68174 RepID=UPI0039DFF51C